MKKLRIIHVVYSFGTGGMEKGVATIVGNTSEYFEHIILCLSSSGLTEHLLPRNTKIVELNKPAGNSVFFLLKLARTLKAFSPAIIHTRNWGGTDAIIAGRLAGIHTVIHGEHGWEISDAEGKNLKRLRIRQFLSRWVREYTCVSQHQKQWLENIVKVNKPVTQIYNGVDTQRFCPGENRQKIRKELEIPPDIFLVGIIGRLDPIKNHPILFQAVKNLRSQFPAIRLLVVGDGEERSHLEKLRDNSIILLGNRLDVPTILQALDVFVLPSCNEGISNTLLEAMASTLPVIATRVGGNIELVQQNINGFLVPVGDVNAITSALLQYAMSPNLREQHGQAGRRIAIEQFSIDRMVRGYEKVYHRVASGQDLIV